MLRNPLSTKPSVTKFSDRLTALERNDIKPPTADFVACLMADNYPHSSKDDILPMLRRRIWMRKYRSEKFKPEYASGAKYHLDSMEELEPSKMDNAERELLQEQRARRQRIGSITNAYFDNVPYGTLIIEVAGSDDLPQTAEEYLALIARENINS